MSQGDQYFDCGFRFLSHEANSALQALRAQYEVRLIETRHAIVHEGWVTTEAGRMISHSAQIRLVDVLVEMVETLYESAAKAYTSAVGSSEYKERVDYVEQQLLGYSLRRWAQLTHGLPMVQVDCDPVAGTAARSNEQLLSDTLTAHIQSKALKLELNMWKAEAAAQSGEFATGKLQSEPPANRPEAAGPHRVAKAATGEDHFLKFLDPDHLRQMGERFPELASVLPGIAGAASFIRDMEAAKAKAEIAFRQHEVAEKWGSWDLDREDIDTQVDRFGDFGTTYPWHPAGCEYVWEMASTYMRSAFGDYKPDKFESMAQLVIDVYSEKVYEEKLKSYEKALWITYERSKAEFQECARKRLDPLVRAECLNRWQKRSAAISPGRVDGECSVGTARADGKAPDKPRQEAQSADGPPDRTPAQPDENDSSHREGSDRFAALVAHLQEIMAGATKAPKRPALDHLSEAGFLRIEAAVLEIEAKARDTILSSFATMLPSQEHSEVYEHALDSGDDTAAKWLTTLIFREYVGLPIFDVVAQECLETAPHTEMPACLEAAARFALAHMPSDDGFIPDLRIGKFKLYMAKSIRRQAESGTAMAQAAITEDPSPTASEPPGLASPGPDAATQGQPKALPTTTEQRSQHDDLSTLKAQPAAVLAPATSRNASGGALAEGIDRGTRLTIEIFPSTCSFIPEKLTWDVEEIVDRHEGNIRQAVLEVLNGLRSSPSTPALLSLIFDAVTEMGTELFNAALFRLDWIDDYNPPDAFDRVADTLYLDGLNFVVKKYESVVAEIPRASPVCGPALLDALRTEWLQIREETKRDVHESSMEVREAQGFGADAFAQLRAEAAGDVGAADQESRSVGLETTHGIAERKRPITLSAGEESELAAALSRIDAEMLESIREVKTKGLGSSDPHAWAAKVVRLWINQSINAVAQAWFSADLALEEYCMQIERVAWALHSKAIQHFMATCGVVDPSASSWDLRTEVNEDFRYVLAVRARGWCRRFNEKLLLYSAGGGRKGELFTESAAAFVKRSKAFVFEIPQQMMAQELENNGATPLGPTRANMGNTKHAEPQFMTADGLDGPSAVDHPNAGPAQTGSGTAQASIAIPRQEDTKEQPRKARKGDATLLDGKRLVNFETAEQYLGISDRQRQKLMSNGALIVEGQGQNRKITVESLKAYLPPEIPN